MAMSSWLRQALNIYAPVSGSVSRSAISQTRMKLTPSLFSEIDNGIKEIFYSQNDIERWNSYRVVGMDGTSLITNKAIYTEEKLFLPSRRRGLNVET